MKMILAIGTFGCIGLAAAAANAAYINPSSYDSEVDDNNSMPPTITVDNTTGSGASYEARIGEYYSPGGACYVIPFQIPTLPAGQVFTSAAFQTQLYGLSGSPDPADLYGVRVSASPTVQTSDYYQGPLDSSSTLIQQDYLTSSSPPRTDATTGPFIETTTAGDAALVSYLNAIDLNGSAAGEYVFLRVSYDDSTIPVGNNAYDLLTEEAGGTYEKPELIYTSGAGVPEPTGLSVLGLVGAAALHRRRRR
jgi:hypothetical protein